MISLYNFFEVVEDLLKPKKFNQETSEMAITSKLNLLI